MREFGVEIGFGWLIIWFGLGFIGVCMLVYYSICDIRTPAALCTYPVVAPSLVQPITSTMT